MSQLQRANIQPEEKHDNKQQTKGKEEEEEEEETVCSILTFKVFVWQTNKHFWLMRNLKVKMLPRLNLLSL